jgi:transposase
VSPEEGRGRASGFQKRMARPVCKQFRRHDPISLHQRIRPVGMTPAKMEIRAPRSS